MSTKIATYQKFDFTGSEAIESQDLRVPSLVLLQALSKEPLAKHKAAKPGMLLNDITEQLWDLETQPLTVIPFYVVKNYHLAEKQPNGKEKSHGTLDQLPTTALQVEGASYYADAGILSPAGIPLKIYPCYTYFVMLEDGSPAKLVCKKTRFKVARKFNTLIKLNKGPVFGHKYSLGTFVDSYDGNEWFNFTVAKSGECTPEEYNKAGSLAQEIAPKAGVIAQDEIDE